MVQGIGEGKLGEREERRETVLVQDTKERACGVAEQKENKWNVCCYSMKTNGTYDVTDEKKQMEHMMLQTIRAALSY